ncbi:MAG: glyoxalase family protein [Bacteroidetes bacterium]|nr:glyoxalase family protein [Bacteroidota bacterium]
MSNLKSIHHAAIICSDYEKSKDFYVSKLGCKIVAETFREARKSYKLDLQIGEGGGQIELFSFENPPKRASWPEACGLRHLAFVTNNIEKSVAELNAKGIETEPIRLDEITGKRFVFFDDPDNLPLELYELE